MSRRQKPATAVEAPPKARKRGRPKKPVLPPVTGPAVPAAPAAPGDPAEALRQMATAAAARQAKGERLAHHEAKALREAWLLDQATHLWRSKEAAAAELSVSVGTLAGWQAQGCPGLPSQGAGDGQSPIPKALVLAWLLRHAHERGGNAPATQETVEDQEARWRRLRADRLEGALVAEAEDRARAALISIVSQLRHDLVHVWPGSVADLLCQALASLPGATTSPLAEAFAALDRTALESAISRWADQRAHDLPQTFSHT